MGAFKKLQNSVAKEYEKKGVSPKKAQQIGAGTAAKIGFNKYGKSGMASKAKAGRGK